MSYDEHLISMAGGDGDALDLDAIQARADAATEGPWISVRHDLTLYVEAESRELNPINVGYVGNRPEPDAEFIAAARTDVPTLLALVREQQARIERVEAECANTDVGSYDALQADLVDRIRAALTATERP